MAPPQGDEASPDGEKSLQRYSSKCATLVLNLVHFDCLNNIRQSSVEIDGGDGEFRMDDIEEIKIKNEIDQIMQNVDNIMKTIETIYPQNEEESVQEEN